MNFFKRITNSTWFALLVFAVAMPINGALVHRGDSILGILLILSQLPWFLNRIGAGRGARQTKETVDLIENHETE